MEDYATNRMQEHVLRWVQHLPYHTQNNSEVQMIRSSEGFYLCRGIEVPTKQWRHVGCHPRQQQLSHQAQGGAPPWKRGTVISKEPRYGRS